MFPVPTEHSSNCPQTVLTVARLYIEPTLKGESGPVGDPVVGDPMHPSAVHLSRNRTLTQFGSSQRVARNESLRGSPTLPVPRCHQRLWPTQTPRWDPSIPYHVSTDRRPANRRPRDHPRMCANTNEGVTCGATQHVNSRRLGGAKVPCSFTVR